MSATNPNHDVTKLPQWAQRQLDAAESSAEYWRTKARLAESGDTEVFIRSNTRFASDALGLPPESTIQFMLRNQDGEDIGRFDVRIKDGLLEVTGVGERMSDQLRTLHHSSNIMFVELTPWTETS
jgi:hypothetical protein